jgi:hypothetical protein
MSYANSGMTSIKNNRQLLKTRKGTLDLLQDFALSSKQPVYRFKKSTPEMLEQIKAFKQLENKRNARKQFILAAFCGLLFVMAIWMIFYY